MPLFRLHPQMPKVELHLFISAMQYAMNTATSVQYWPTTPHTTKSVSANTLPTPAASSTEYQYPIPTTAEILTGQSKHQEFPHTPDPAESSVPHHAIYRQRAFRQSSLSRI
jgi:hypothetical protein